MQQSYPNQAIQRITVNLPKTLLEEAQKVTSRGITETVIEGLKLLKKQRAYQKAMQLKGKLNLEIDLESTRERNRH